MKTAPAFSFRVLAILLAFGLFLLLAFDSQALATQKRAKPLNIRNNDVYLISDDLYKLFVRYRAGEIFPLLEAMEKIAKKSAHLPSMQYFLGVQKLQLTFHHNRKNLYDDEIKAHFQKCITLAKAAKRRKRIKDAGEFWHGACLTGLSMFEVMRKAYVDGGMHGREGLEILMNLHKRRPDIDALNFAMGVYNYKTSSMGFFSRVLLKVLLLPVGEKEKGLRLLEKAAKPGATMDVVAMTTLGYLLAMYENRPKEAVKLGRQIVDLTPQNASSHLSLAHFLFYAGRLQEALEEAKITKKLLAETPFQDPRYITYIRYREEIRALHHLLRVLLFADENALNALYKRAKSKKAVHDLRIDAFLYLGHIHRFAGLNEKASELYEKATECEGSRSMRDLAQSYQEKKRDITKEIPLDNKKKQALKKMLSNGKR